MAFAVPTLIVRSSHSLGSAALDDLASASARAKTSNAFFLSILMLTADSRASILCDAKKRTERERTVQAIGRKIDNERQIFLRFQLNARVETAIQVFSMPKTPTVVSLFSGAGGIDY